MTIGKRAFQCIRKGTCPERAGADGCHVWWEYPVASGEIKRCCALSQEGLFTLMVEAIHLSSCAAASANQATNAACEGTLVAKEARQAAGTAMALVLGVVSGEIAHPHPQLEGPDDDNKEVPRIGRPIR